jgi:thiamine pyridinylase
MEKDFEAAYPEIDLEIMNLPDYYGDPYGVLVNQADVYECDEGMLEAMKAAGKLQPLATSEVPNPDDFLQITKDVAVDSSGAWWGIPHWTCTDFMFYNKNDTELAAVKTFSELEKVIGGKDHPLGEGLLIDIMGSYVTNRYKDTLMDLYKDNPATFWSYVNKDNINTQAVDLMKRMISLEDPGNGRNALNDKMSDDLIRKFIYGNGRAYVYYSEALGYMADIIDNAQNTWFDTTLSMDDIGIMPFYQADTPVSASTGYVDSFCLDKSLTGQKRADALTFAQWVTSTAENIRQVAPPDGSAVRYLSPARMSVYTAPSLLAIAPLYK